MIIITITVTIIIMITITMMIILSLHTIVTITIIIIIIPSRGFQCWSRFFIDGLCHRFQQTGRHPIARSMQKADNETGELTRCPVCPPEDGDAAHRERLELSDVFDNVRRHHRKVETLRRRFIIEINAIAEFPSTNGQK